MRQENENPARDDGDGDDAHDVRESGVGQEIANADDGTHEETGEENGAVGNAAVRQFGQTFRRIAVERQTVQHSGVAVQAAVVGGENGDDDDDIQNIRRGRNAERVEDFHEGAAFRADEIPWVEADEDENGTDIEN